MVVLKIAFAASMNEGVIIERKHLESYSRFYLVDFFDIEAHLFIFFFDILQYYYQLKPYFFRFISQYDVILEYKVWFDLPYLAHN
jgi:hypothetical protein